MINHTQYSTRKLTTLPCRRGGHPVLEKLITCITACFLFSGSFFKPALLAATPAPILGVPEIIAIIVELAAGQALDAWLNNNQDPRQDKTNASAVGAYYTAARYRMVETISPRSACPGGSSTTYQNIALSRQGNERHTDPTGDPIDELKKRARLSGWLKTIEVIDDQGNCASPGSWTVCGSSSTPYSALQTLANLQAIYDDPSLRLGNDLVDKTEQWNVGKFVVYSDYTFSTGALHRKLKEEGYYPAEMRYEKQAVHYFGGKLTGIGQKVKLDKRFNLRADRPDKRYFNLVGCSFVNRTVLLFEVCNCLHQWFCPYVGIENWPILRNWFRYATFGTFAALDPMTETCSLLQVWMVRPASGMSQQVRKW